MDSKEYEYIDEKLAAYAQSDYYPFHMPGHKRMEIEFENPYKIDLTEIDGFDNLHHAQDLLLKSQERLGRLYQSKKSYYLVNGSSGGILSAVGALAKCGDRIIMARNCHKSVYNAAKLFRLKAQFVYPKVMSCGIQGGIDAADLEQCLQMYDDVRLVILTSPTYDGIVSDIKKIGEITRKYNTYLIIDEAHGAHFSISPYFPESAIRLGADLVIQSLHKTLPCFTQSAALHVASDRIDCYKLEEMLRIFQTSSPSYILMAGMEKCVRMLENKKKQLFDAYYHRLSDFYQKCRQLKCLRVMTADDYDSTCFFDTDKSKIIISTMHTIMSGRELYKMLLEQHHLQLEMYSAYYVLAMTSVMDSQEGFDRLQKALFMIDQEVLSNCKEKCEDQSIAEYKSKSKEINTSRCKEEYAGKINEACERQGKEGYVYQIKERYIDHIKDHYIDHWNDNFLKIAYAQRKKVLEMYEIDDDNIEEKILDDCIGKISAEYIYLYPPGIPMIVPGEIITAEFTALLERCRKSHMNVQGTKDQQYRKILTVAHLQ